MTLPAVDRSKLAVELPLIVQEIAHDHGYDAEAPALLLDAGPTVADVVYRLNAERVFGADVEAVAYNVDPGSTADEDAVVFAYRAALGWVTFQVATLSVPATQLGWGPGKSIDQFVRHAGGYAVAAFDSCRQYIPRVR